MALKVLYSRIWQAQFQAASAWLDQASAHNQTTLTAASLPSQKRFLGKSKSLHIDQVDLQTFHQGLPQYDEDGLMAELRALPDQDELEETKVPGTW